MSQLVKVQIIPFRKTKELEFLILHTSPMRRERIWQGVTGGVEVYDKSIRESALRELKEELNIDGKEERLIGPLSDFTFTTMRKGYENTLAKEYCFGYEVEDSYEVKLSREHSDYKWLPYEEAIQLIDHDEPKKLITLIKSTLTSDEHKTR